MQLSGSELLTHYYRPFSRPLLSVSELSEARRSEVLDRIAGFEPLPLRLTRADYFERRHQLEQRMRHRFIEKGGQPLRSAPHYFVLREFSLWESDGSLKVQIRLADVPDEQLSFSLTDSFFNYSPSNLRGIPIPPRSYHGELFRLDELGGQLELYELPTEEWRSLEARRFEPYVEAQIWSDEPVRHLLGTGSESSMIYHLALESDFRTQLDGSVYRPSNLAEDGFVHCASVTSALAVANDYYAAASERLLLLEIDPARLSSETRYEAAAPIPGGGTTHLEGAPRFPHVYGPIDRGAIVAVGVLGRSATRYEWPDTLRPLEAFLSDEL